jgi:tetratricopeptide (TPR) repeat protein
MGYAHFELGEFDRAIKQYNRAIEINPDYAKAYNNRGLVYFVKGEFERAILDYSKAIKIDPDLAKPYDNRGTAYMIIGETEKACDDLKRACELGECSTLDMLEGEGICEFTYLAMTVSY